MSLEHPTKVTIINKNLNIGIIINNGAQRWNRTTDTRIFSPLLMNKNLIRMNVSEVTVHTTVYKIIKI